MTLEQQQVNVTELQRLNEAILLTMDAIRRVVPQLTQTQSPIPGMGAPTIDPITAAYLHGQTQTLRAIFGQGQMQQPQMGMQYGQQGYGQQSMVPSIGTLPFGMQGYGQHPLAQLFGQHSFGQQFGQHPFTQMGQHPFAQMGQHPFAQQQQPWQVPFGQAFGGQVPVGQPWPSPVNYSGIGGLGGLGVGGIGAGGIGGLGGVGGGVGNAQRPF